MSRETVALKENYQYPLLYLHFFILMYSLIQVFSLFSVNGEHSVQHTVGLIKNTVTDFYREKLKSSPDFYKEEFYNDFVPQA